MIREDILKKFDSNIAGNYERYFVPSIGEPLAQDLVDFAQLKPGEHVLDVACGTGIAARLAFNKVQPRGTVAGLDMHPGMLAVARTIPENDEKIEWYEATAEAMPFADDRFDVVLCQMGLQFMENKNIALREMLRVLKTGGRLVLNVPGPRQKLFAIMAEAMKENITAQAADFVNVVFSLYDKEKIVSLFNQAAFKDLEVNAYEKTLDLPQAREFLWQYLYSTPLATAIEQADDNALLALENDVTTKWRDFVYNGGLRYKQRMVQVKGYKS